MATRVFELARELGVTSKMVLEKCRAEGLEIKNHMATVSVGLQETIREWFSEGGAATAVETAEHVDLEKARKSAARQRRRRRKHEEAERAAAAEAAESPVAEAPPEAPEAAPAEEGEAVAEAPSEAAAVEEAPEAEAPVEEAEAPTAEAPAEEEAEPETEEVQEEEQPEVIAPAGPQVVPKPAQLKGPRVVRVEKPDVVRKPTPRAPLIPTGRGPGVVAGAGRPAKGKGAGPAEEGGRKRTKRRSPRRRGAGRSADSGERLKEWRDADLQERSERLAAASGGLRRRRASVTRKIADRATTVKAGRVEIDEPITIKAMSAATGIKSADIIKRLMDEGVIATVNQVISREQAEAVALDYDVELVVAEARTAEQELLEKLKERSQGEQAPRPPVVTFLGHVDHGKTSLLDYIRQAQVAEGEAGGITQHMGAYRFDRDDTHVVFLDTPGHEAFTAMRARGANMTDVVVLVVAADDGVMPQTVEAISHARAAEVPIVVALNKIDVPNANVQRALGQLAENDLQPREWGGPVEVIQTSAETGDGIDTLVETLNLESQLLELTAEPEAPASGFVIESEVDPGRGVLARLLVRDGTLKTGDMLLAGRSYGRVRRILDDRGREIEQAGPSTPVEVTGLDEAPDAGDRFYVVENIDQARTVAEDRRTRARAELLAGTGGPVTLENLLSEIESGDVQEVKLIVKADVQGSAEALVGSLTKLGTDEAKVNVLHRAVGGVTTSDVALAEASGAIIIAFNVVADSAARQLAEEKGVDVRRYRVIYDVTEDVRRALEEGLAPEVREEVLAHAEVRQIFKVSRVGTIAGCYVTDGTVPRNASVRVTRDNVVIADERELESLRRFKDDVREVRADMECGLKIAGYDDLKEGDVLEFYQQVEVARTL